MPGTVTTTEECPKNTPKDRLDTEVELRILAGAIRSWYEEKPDKILLFTKWNVIGEQ